MAPAMVILYLVYFQSLFQPWKIFPNLFYPKLSAPESFMHFFFCMQTLHTTPIAVDDSFNAWGGKNVFLKYQESQDFQKCIFQNL